MASNDTLSFAELERRLREIPDDPAALLDSPPAFRIANIVGGVAAVFTVIPYLLIQVLPPAKWMLTWTQIGFAVFFMMLLPGLVRSYAMLGWNLWTWRTDLVNQLDHDMPHSRAILAWLSQRPVATLEEYERVTRLSLKQLSAKIGMFSGGLERLGVLPALASFFLFAMNWDDLLDLPYWQLILGFGLILFYFVVLVANLKRIRLQLYESLLSEALAVKASRPALP